MTEPKQTRRDAIRSFLAFPFVAGLLVLPGCGSGEKEFPVIPNEKPKDELQKDIENPFGVQLKEPKAKKRR